MSDMPPVASRSPDERPSRGWVRWLLVVSLGFNLIILGLTAGHVLSRAMRGEHGPERNLAFGPFTEALTPADRHALIHQFFQEARSFTAERAAMRADFDLLVGALKATPYDPAVFAGVLDRQEQRNKRWLALGQKLLMERVAAMTPAERAAFADRLQADVARHRRPPPK